MACLPFLCLCLFLFHLLFQPTACASNFSSSSSTQIVLCPRHETIALLQLKNSLSLYTSPYYCGSYGIIYRISYPKTKSWREDTDCCSWDGVTCDAKTGHVIGLDLACSMLQGTISSNSTLFLLPHLQKLDLSYNNLSSSPVSVKFGHLLKLTHLNLNGSYFVGHVPYEISHLSRLLSLDLSFNYELILEPNTFNRIVQNLTKLQKLHLNYINLSLVAPNSLGNLSSSLSSLKLYSCGLQGDFPVNMIGRPILRGSANLRWLGNLKQLTVLDLSFNNLGGEIPSSLGNLVKLNYLYLRGNNFNGQIPQNFANLTQLSFLDLKYNNIGGQIPSFLGNLTNLIHLVLSYNNFTGPIPISIFKDVNLTALFLSSNHHLTGEIPSSICNLKSLLFLDLSNNSLSSFIPQCFGNFSDSLLVLHLGTNNLQGTIPSTFLEGNDLRYLNLNGNKFKGPIPPSISNFTNLEILDLGNNEIEDAFPYFLEALPKLQVLVLRSNKLYGSIKTSGSNYLFPSLRILDLSNNSLSGTLPTNFKIMMEHGQKMGFMYMGSNLGSYVYSLPITWKGVKIVFVRIFNILTIIDLSSNKFTGKIPESIGKLISLQALNLSHNYLSGPMPPSLGNLTNLESLDLSSNFLIGKIPVQLVALTFLEVLNVSNNRLEGPIPLGKQFNTFDGRSYEGNSRLCDFPLLNCNIGERQHTSFFQEEEDSKLVDGFGWEVVVMGYGFGLLFGFTMGCIMFKIKKPARLVRIIEGELLQQFLPKWWKK